MRKIKIPTPEEKRIEELERENAEIKEVNLSLKEAQAETNTNLLEFMETILMGGI